MGPRSCGRSAANLVAPSRIEGRPVRQRPQEGIVCSGGVEETRAVGHEPARGGVGVAAGPRFRDVIRQPGAQHGFLQGVEKRRRPLGVVPADGLDDRHQRGVAVVGGGRAMSARAISSSSSGGTLERMRLESSALPAARAGRRGGPGGWRRARLAGAAGGSWPPRSVAASSRARRRLCADCVCQSQRASATLSASDTAISAPEAVHARRCDGGRRAASVGTGGRLTSGGEADKAVSVRQSCERSTSKTNVLS